ncbi:hypothetical protein [Nostoc sp. NMS7]|nr:hypothetical protein [Nostoc sp. NMS7]
MLTSFDPSLRDATRTTGSGHRFAQLSATQLVERSRNQRLW